MRRSDVARLKELRRRLDSGQCTLEEINQITVELMGECAEVSLPQDLQDMTDDSSHPTTLETRSSKNYSRDAPPNFDSQCCNESLLT
jgi:hypothetical protein